MSTDETLNWGMCVDCRWWQIEPQAIATHQTTGACREPDMSVVLLRVTGNSGCGKFASGAPSRSEGASGKPPAPPPNF
ncbi:MAG: hypothetical protein KF774_15590 [Planctomyces sp.]|nr:hypothetical protein [Planctomyces sp.]